MQASKEKKIRKSPLSQSVWEKERKKKERKREERY
jgi:hypothetical protein